MKKVFERPASLRDVPTHYCSGCGHSIAHRLICEVIDELGIREDVIAVCPVGCAVIAYEYWDFDCSEAPHGRTPCVATGIKRVHPDKVVFSYQGDGDLAAIGTAEIIHTANRGENITVFFINNGVYGMTNGQMAPTTLIGQKTSTSIHGRDITRDGYPIKISELLSQLPGAKYIERVSVDNPANVLKTKAAIKKALKNQMEGKGFSLVEILSPCPTYWGLSPKDACRRIEDELTKYFPLGVIKDI
ncbi:MAG TPA: thiamine pyrophosphate-dependent enzyme [Candidatus Omnitrophota bacterium]|nr:2-oxoglutarate oxidoreductase [Candidatus Omnitrophota bacterium]HOX09267.1 thiamine pyrophosphate-dependent enzyme [Candidatus Omnitrophota bacterium]HPN66181.1 thiamine pyrophosphate-dependent enzyme [Candidatus Omnitrophota bacterium]HRZ67699.1 thiamine pyrophosphate-dependent enzyme [Candidatus Omnitrophota bacterium]